MTTSRGNEHTETSQPYWLEWAVGGVCTLLVVGLFAWIGRDIYRYEVQEAEFNISIVSLNPAKEGYRLTVDIHNTSLATASEVHVRGDLPSSGLPESSDVNFDYVGSESHATGTLFFRTNPASGTPDLRVTGYTEP